MSDKSLMDRWCSMMKIAPHDCGPSNQNSWSEKSRNLLSTERKVFAIKITESNRDPVDADQLTGVKKKKKNIHLLMKWIEKCQWKLPKAMILFSVLQVRTVLIEQFFPYLIELSLPAK